MKRTTTAAVAVLVGVLAVLVAASVAGAKPAAPQTVLAIRAPGGPAIRSGATFTCEAATATLHCATPADIRAAYGVDKLGDVDAGTGLLGEGQTIVLVDSYGSPTAQQDLQTFHDTFFPSLPNPSFTQVFPNGKTDFNNSNGNGQSGPAAAAGWSGEATLDIEWAYAIAPLANIVLVAVPPAETEGVQGFPNLFKAIAGLVASEPAGTVF
ncbi:MAG TPA: hypothetical protein VFS26_07565, partial [Solirubrobacterales bacterium]|nr:hypothetical protein [Solirubrobacterales bacterium]